MSKGMKYELICIDIDGTLLDNEKKLHDKVRESVCRAHGEGAVIVLGSARLPGGVELIEKALGIGCIRICNAGAYILSGGRCILNRHLRAEDMETIWEKYAEKNGLNMWIFFDRDWYVTGMDPFIEKEIPAIGCQPGMARVSELAEIWKREATGPSKLLIAAQPEEVERIRTEFLEEKARGMWSRTAIAKSSDFFLEFFPEGVDKGSALRAICDSLGIPPEKTAAIGDQEMDLPMIRTAGLGIAMGNAAECLKEAADYVTRSNEEDGVAYAIDYILSR